MLSHSQIRETSHHKHIPGLEFKSDLSPNTENSPTEPSGKLSVVTLLPSAMGKLVFSESTFWHIGHLMKCFWQVDFC